MDTVVNDHIRAGFFKGFHHGGPFVVRPAVILVADEDVVAGAAGDGIVEIAVDAGILVLQHL